MAIKKIILLLLTITGASVSISAQKQHRVVFEITSADSADYRVVLRSVNNVLKDAPGTKVEIVCHGPAIFMLVKEKTVLSDIMQELQNKQGVSFAACANSMRKNNLEKSQLIPVATVVPNGVMEVVSKQEEGWSYIKSGH
jgi:intracellular sulfur oxidation DsrE/DsrF family protein